MVYFSAKSACHGQIEKNLSDANEIDEIMIYIIHTTSLPSTHKRIITHTNFHSRRERPLPAAEDQATPLPDPDQSRRLHQRPSVRWARSLRRAASLPAATPEHHLADDRTDPVCQAVWSGACGQLAPGNAAWRSVTMAYGSFTTGY